MSQTAAPPVVPASTPYGYDDTGAIVESVTVTASRIKEPQWPLYLFLAAVAVFLFKR